MTEPEAKRFLERASVAHVGVVEGETPYVSPLSFVVDGDRILFRTMPGRRLSAIESNPRVCVEAASFDEASGEWASVIVTGQARLATDDVTRQLVLAKLYEKYRESLGSPLSRGEPQLMALFPHVVVVNIDHISGMTSSGLFARTRPGRL